MTADEMSNEVPSALSILLIEDNLADQRLVEIALREAAEDTPSVVQSVATLADGLGLLAGNRYDAVLLDLGLPDAEGLEGLEAIQRACKETPVIVLTGLSDFSTARRAIKQGAADYLDKGELQSRPLARAIRYAIERAEKDLALRESEVRFRDILLASPDGVLIIGQSGEVLLANTRAELMFGYAPGELEGKPLLALMPGDGSPARRSGELTDAGLTGNPSLNFGNTPYGVRKDGSAFPVEVNLGPSSDNEGAATIAAIRDISDRKAMESQLLKSQKMEAIGTLTGGMAHDFNNLLAVIIGNLDLLAEDGNLSDVDRPLVDEALEAALRGAELTQRLLAFARRQPLQPRQIDVDDLVDGLCKLAHRTLGADIQLRFRRGKNVPPIIADAAQLEACLFNIINNARDAMVNGGEITVATDLRYLDADFGASHEIGAGHYTMIEVRDNGAGMSPEISSQIFEPFFTTKEPGKGTGLGLSLVYGFIKQSGGQVYVYSEVGVGTIFRLYLPSVLTAGDEHELKQDSRPTEQGREETILVVEDNSSLRQLVAKQLKALGYRFLGAQNGQDAMEILETEKVDLLFTDVVMPGGVSGYDLAKTTAERWPNVKVVLTSGFPDAKLNISGKPPENTRLLLKPYRRHELAEILRNALDSED
jgi:PAS domain S-box-containing protein